MCTKKKGRITQNGILFYGNYCLNLKCTSIPVPNLPVV